MQLYRLVDMPFQIAVSLPSTNWIFLPVALIALALIKNRIMIKLNFFTLIFISFQYNISYVGGEGKDDYFPYAVNEGEMLVPLPILILLEYPALDGMKRIAVEGTLFKFL